MIFPLIANASYDRNTARPVNKIVFGHVDSVRYISKEDIRRSHANGWETLLGGVIGGIIGYQFGGGRGQQVATAVGAVAGAGIAQSQQSQEYRVEYKLVELLIKTDKGKFIDVIQDVDPDMLFHRGDSVRILYFDDGVRVDTTYDSNY
nr:glycine zipper 2TM domain-containing protein [Vibrio sinus]